MARLLGKIWGIPEFKGKCCKIQTGGNMAVSNIEDKLTQEECEMLLNIARESLEFGILGKALPPLDFDSLSGNLKEEGASFVTLTVNEQLRGCIGAIEPYQSLAEDVREHAIAAATKDYRFPRVTPGELMDISIEISRLTPPRPLLYSDAKDLLNKLRPGVDGVVLRDGFHRATFLPQVWEKIPDPEGFLNHLCRKMGVPAKTWREKKLEVLIYQVQEFHE
jgi:AmmeMemoRadiSam system protein A